MKPLACVAGVVLFVVTIIVIANVTPPRVRPGHGLSSRAAEGLISGGMVKSIEWSDPVIVTVPTSWHDLRESARERYLFAIWEASANKADLRVVDEAGALVQVYTPPATLPD